MSMKESILVTYNAPTELPRSNDYSVRVKTPVGEWVELSTYLVRVDMHNVREATMASFDFNGTVQVEVTSVNEIEEAVIRPLSQTIHAEIAGKTIRFTLNEPAKLTVEINGERFHNLHLFANELEQHVPDPQGEDTICLHAGSYCVNERVNIENPRLIYFAEGLHYFEDGLFSIPSNTTVYIAGGAVIVGSLLCSHALNVTIGGRGFIYLREIEKTTYWRSIDIRYSSNVTVRDLVSIDPPHYSIHLGQSENIRIHNFKAFSTRGWCDGIDMMSCSNVRIDDVFLRTSDDCIAVYGSRGEYKGDTSNIHVTNAILWADVAHPIMIGCHGDYDDNGNVIENLVFDNIDILEHHEPQDGYWGCIAINAGDSNTVRHAVFRRIRIEQFELGRLFDIRVFQNPKYNPTPGRLVEHVYFEDISFDGECQNPSVIAGYDEERIVSGIHFRNLRINGKIIRSLEEGNFQCSDFQQNVTFQDSSSS